MEEGIKQRTIKFVKSLNITMKNFENQCGLSNGYVSAMRKGFGRAKLENVLSSFPQLNRDWLLYGEGEMLRSPITQTATGHHINQSVGDSGLTAQLEKANREIERLQSQLAKAQEQNDRLLKIIENMSK